MRAVVQGRYGGPGDLELREVPRPEPGEGQGAGLLEEGRLTPILDSVWPLEETAAALRHMVEGELLGKVVVRVG